MKNQIKNPNSLNDVRILFLAFVVIIGSTIFASGQVIKSFTQRAAAATPTKLIYNIRGDYTMIGNTNLTLVNYDNNTNNSNNDMKYVDVDGDANTINSSSATLGFSTENGANPLCSNIIYAGLYWTGRAADVGGSPETFTVTTSSPQSLPVNQNYTVTNGNSIQYTDYSVSVSRVGSNNSYGVRYTFTSSGTGPQVLFEFLFAGPPYIRYSTNGGTTWTNPTNQVTSVPSSNLRKVDFDPVIVYAPSGGIILTVNSLVRDSRGNQSSSSYQNSAVASGNVSGTAIVQVSTNKTLNKRTISLKGPGQSNYTQFVANPGNIYYPDGVYGNMYSGYVEVTSYVKANGIGNYTVADIALIEGDGGSTGYYGGWGMIVVYENSKMNWRDVTIFDGYAYVLGGTAQYELPVSGFQTVQAGQVNLKLGIMAGEGDVGISGDYFKIRNWQDNTWITLSDAGNSTNNFFDGAIVTGGNARNPNLQNNTGMDLHMFNIPNSSNSIITNNQTSTKFQYGSTQDTYIIFCIAMAVDAYVPDVESLISTETINGFPVGSGTYTVQPGQDIEYKLQVKNHGTEAVNNTKFTIPIPYTTTYVSGSGSTTINFTPAPVPNNFYFDSLMGPTGSVVWDFGTLPMPPVGFPDSVLAEIIFHLTVTTDCNILKNQDCPPKVTLSGGVTSGTGAISGTNFSDMPFIQGYQSSGGCAGEPITDPLQVSIDANSYLAANCQSTPNNHAFIFCNYTLSTIPVSNIVPSFPAGLHFFNTNNITPNSIEYDNNNPFPAIPGTTTYFAIPIGVNLCYYTFTISVSDITSLPTASNVIYCLNDFAAPLTATPSNPAYTLNYYTSLTSTTPLVSITPSTAAAGITTYYIAEVAPLSLGGCESANRLPITVTVYDFHANISSQTNIYCNGGNTGVASVSATGGSGNYSYSWNTTPTQTTAFATELTAGNYIVTVNDNNGCGIIQTATLSITEPPIVLGASITSQTNVFCKDGNTGDATITATGGSGNYSYSWSTIPTQNTSTATGLSAGNYTVTVTDNNGCTIPTNAVAIITEPAVLSSSVLITSNYNGQSISCNGTNDGSIDLIVSGGTPTYAYNWNNGSTNEDISSIGAGTYSVIITDANGCTATNTITLTQPVAISTTISVSSNYNGENISCKGMSDGSVSLNVEGGTPAYTYAWSNSATTQNINWVNANNYSVVVADANGCVAVNSITVTDPPLFSSSVNITSNVNCFGDHTGIASVTPSGGTMPYSYLWSNGDTNSTANGLGAGNYSIKITDANNCSLLTGTFTITEPSILSSSTSSTNVYCYGENNGTASVNVNGGIPGYSYLWSNGQTSSTASNLSAGTYTVEVTDYNGCSFNTTATITQPNIFTSSFSQINVNCNGMNNGTIDLSITGGMPGYTYAWNNGATTEDISGLNAATYSVVITDTNGCTSQNSIVITEPTIISATTSSTNVLCYGEKSGAASVIVNGGTPGYTYLWNNGQTSTTVGNLVAGTYSVLITDANGCSTISSVTVTEPLLLALTTSGTSTSCNGGNNGTASVFVSGGTSPYNYFWNNGQTTSTISGLASGTYSVQVTDANGCSKSASVNVSEQSPVQLLTSNANPSCYGDKNGFVILNVTGGIAPYTYNWSNGETTQNLSDLNSGIYIVNVLDGNHCAGTATIILTQPDSISATLIVAQYPNGYNITLNGMSNGSIDLHVFGGTPPYSYNWSNGSITEDLNNIGAGSYTVIVTDANGCTYRASINLTEPFVLEMPTGFSPNGDGMNDYFVVHGLESYPINDIAVYNRWGNIVYSKDNYMNQWNGHNNNGDDLPDATYFVVLTINGGDITLKGYVDLRR